MLKFSIDHFSKKEREAFAAAIAITNQIKACLLSKESITIQKLVGVEKLGADGVALLEEFIAALNSDAVTNSTALINTFLGGLGAQLTGLCAEGCRITKGIDKWIHTFEGLYRHSKKQS